eukprot:c16380_g1_i1 orf=93-347(-)
MTGRSVVSVDSSEKLSKNYEKFLRSSSAPVILKDIIFITNQITTVTCCNDVKGKGIYRTKLDLKSSLTYLQTQGPGENLNFLVV